MIQIPIVVKKGDQETWIINATVSKKYRSICNHLINEFVDFSENHFGNNMKCTLYGGCVRDLLAGKTPVDYDINVKTTHTIEEQMIKLFSDIYLLTPNKEIIIGSSLFKIIFISKGTDFSMFQLKTTIDNENIMCDLVFNSHNLLKDFEMNSITCAFDNFYPVGKIFMTYEQAEDLWRYKMGLEQRYTMIYDLIKMNKNLSENMCKFYVEKVKIRLLKMLKKGVKIEKLKTLKKNESCGICRLENDGATENPNENDSYDYMYLELCHPEHIVCLTCLLKWVLIEKKNTCPYCVKQYVYFGKNGWKIDKDVFCEQMEYIDLNWNGIQNNTCKNYCDTQGHTLNSSPIILLPLEQTETLERTDSVVWPPMEQTVVWPPPAERIENTVPIETRPLSISRPLTREMTYPTRNTLGNYER